MKLLLALFMLFAGFYSIAQTFSPQNSGVSTPLNAICFSTPSTGMVVGNSGVIRKTSDAGLTWTASNSGTTADLTDIAFIGASTYVAVGKTGTILKTTNFGASWTPVNSGTSYDLMSVFANGPTVYASGDNGTILASTNSGNAWSTISTGISFKLNEVFFVSNLVGYAVGDGGTILRSVNAGQAWDFIPSGTNTHTLTDVWFSDEAHGVIMGAISASNESTILRTTNSGSVFTTSDLSGTFLNGVSFADYSNGFAVGGSITGNTGTILKTTNQGASWTPIASTSSRLLGVCYPNTSIAYACGLNGTILRYAANTAGLDENGELDVQIGPNPGNGLFSIASGTNELFSVEVFTTSGQLIAVVESGNQIDLTRSPNGIYVAVIRSGSLTAARKLVKE
jgi:photosystem II stability/assembly factor-like uncharacterized protein